MNHPHYPYRQQARIHQQTDGIPAGQSYPPYGYPPVDINTPYTDPFLQQPPAPAQGTTGGLGGLLGGGKAGQMLGELQGFVNRMGGIDGILSTVGKVQKLMSTVQQITPMLGLLLNKKTAASTLKSTSEYGRRSSYRRRRRRSRRRSRRTGRSGYSGSRSRSRARRR